MISINRMNLKSAALAYAFRGWPVLPLEPRGKRPLVDFSLGLKNGLKQASSDPKLVSRWWDRHPSANIGLRTGVVFDVLDLDGPDANAAMLREAPRYRHEGPLSSTGKGFHLLFQASGSKNHARLMQAPVDFRGDGGYIVAPPSIHPLGHSYKWAKDGQLTPLPDWLKPYVFPTKPERRSDPNDPSIREALANAEDIVTVFNSLLGRVDRVGDRYVAYCPFHKDDTASLTIYPDTNSFFCFGCHAWGDPLNVRRWASTGRLRRGDESSLPPMQIGEVSTVD